MKHFEDCEQIAFLTYVELKYPVYYEFMFHVPNGGKRNIVEAARFKNLGVKRGVPDILMLCPKGNYHGLAIEMKKRKVVGKPAPNISVEQKKWLKNLEEAGYCAKIAYGSDEAINIFEKYIFCID